MRESCSDILNAVLALSVIQRTTSSITKRKYSIHPSIIKSSKI